MSAKRKKDSAQQELPIEGAKPAPTETKPTEAKRSRSKPSAGGHGETHVMADLIEGQGNFGNIFTGDPPAAPRYIECRLTDLARTELFNDEITEFVPSYDGRNREPVALPCKLPLTLMLGTEGIAVGLAARILPHNFPELLEAQIAILKKQPFKCLPDFPTGGLMDARDYRDGTGTVKVRAKLKVKDESTVIITEIPPTTTTDSLMASIEDATQKGKLKVKAINEFTSEDVEIEIKCPAGVDAEKLVDALYAFTRSEERRVGKEWRSREE